MKANFTPIRPLFEAALAFACGILIGQQLAIPLVYLWGLMVAGVLAWSAPRVRPFLSDHPSRHRIALIVFMLGLGMLRMEWEEQHWQHMRQAVDDLSYRGEVTVRGTVTEARPYGDTRMSLLLIDAGREQWNRVESIPGTVQMIAPRHAVSVGSRVEATGYLSPVQPMRVPSGMNLQAYRFAQSVFSTLVTREVPNVVRVAEWTPLRGWSHRASAWLDEQWSGREEADAVHGVIAAMALGIRGHETDASREAMQVSGLAHLTSISGLHVTMILSAVGWLLQRLFSRRTTSICLIVISVGYLLFVGVRVPTLRSVLMAWVLLGGLLLRRPHQSLNALGLAALVILFLSPAELLLPSFQLSFGAVLGIMLFPLPSRITPERSWLRWLVQGMWISLITVLVLAPFSLFYFHQIPFAAVPGNLAAAPMVSLILGLTYTWLMLAWVPFSGLHTVLGWMLYTLTDVFLMLVHALASVEWLCWSPSLPSPVLVVLLWMGLLVMHQGMTILLRTPYGSVRMHHAGLLLMALGLWFSPWLLTGDRLRMDFVALGQGDCILIRTPAGHTILKDAGPPPYEGDTRLTDYLTAQGVGRIDALILSHPQTDHMGAMLEVIRQFPVERFVEGSTRHDGETYTALKAAMAERGIPQFRLQKGDEILSGDTRFRVLHPDSQPGRDVNESSLVVWLTLGEFDALLTGDIGLRTEAELCTELDNWDMEVLKVAHHGSRYSTGAGFLQEVRPEFAIIQSGRNPYGHPHPDTRHRLYDVQAHVLRNDYLGTLQLETDGDRVWIYATRANRLYRLQADH